MNRSQVSLLTLGFAFCAGVIATIFLLRHDRFRGTLTHTCQKLSDGLKAEILTRRYYQN